MTRRDPASKRSTRPTPGRSRRPARPPRVRRRPRPPPRRTAGRTRSRRVRRRQPDGLGGSGVAPRCSSGKRIALAFLNGGMPTSAKASRRPSTRRDRPRRRLVGERASRRRATTAGGHATTRHGDERDAERRGHEPTVPSARAGTRVGAGRRRAVARRPPAGEPGAHQREHERVEERVVVVVGQARGDLGEARREQRERDDRPRDRPGQPRRGPSARAAARRGSRPPRGRSRRRRRAPRAAAGR